MFGQSKEKIGVGVITCNRASQFQKLYFSILNCQGVDQVVVVKNKDYDYGNVLQSLDQKKTIYIHEPQDLGVGHCKNLALLELLKSGCQHIFLIEDDITVKDQSVFQEYVATAKEFKLGHLIFGSVYTPPSWALDPVIATFQCNSKKLDIYPNLHGGFVYFSRRCLELVGLFDEKNYINAVEHIDHTYRIIQMGMYTPFWGFADVHDSGRLLQDEQPDNPSTINDKSELQKQRTRHGFQRFAMTYGKQISEIPRVSLREVEAYLKTLNPSVAFTTSSQTAQKARPSKTIKCFSIDHRDTKGCWPFTWTRVGTGFQTDAKLKDTDGESICTERFNTFLGEWTAMWWIWKHIKELGKPDFVGMAQYRRYFTRSKPNYGPFPIVNLEGPHIKQAKLDEICQRVVLSPDQLLSIIESSNSAGILPARFPDYSYMAGCKSIQDLMFAESNFLHLGMPRSLVDTIFQLFQKEAIANGFSAESIQQALQQTNTFHFNMFVLASDDFNICMKIIDQVVMKSIEYIDYNHIEGLHARLFGYVIERLFSCMFFLLSKVGKKPFTELPIVLLPKEAMQPASHKKEEEKKVSSSIEEVKHLALESRPKYSILTFIMGDKYELVHEIQQKQDNVEYVLVTDNKNLKSNTWNVIFDEKLLKYDSPFERCFRVRYNAFDYIRTDTCVTVDGSMEIKGSLDPIVQKFIEEDYDICLMPHPFRFDFISEYQAWVKQRKYPVERTKKFFELLQSSRYDPGFRGLIQLCFSIKKRDCQKTRALDSLVFSFLEYLSIESSFERLDQTVYTFVLNTWFKDLEILPVSEQVVRSEAIQWYCHNSMKKNMNFFMQPGKPDKKWVLNKQVECLQLLGGEAVFPKL